ncbi:baseplate J/gp47 family protein [Dyella sp. 2RAF44]|uniref:baseplate assembly protein n=1 Tax=Dyella sp. 2RAF44 TaxID=3233000 RepID=UPI003F8E835F
MAGSFTAVDLSRLPAPSVITNVPFEQIVAEMLADLRARFPEFSALVESDPAYKILEVAAYREVIIRQRINDAARAVMIAYAVKEDLDNLGALMNVTRLTLVPAGPKNNIPAVMESDEDYRRRIVLAPEGFSVAGPEGAYTFHALSADPSVLDASATSPSPGAVVVTVLSRVGNGTADAALLQTVNDSVSAADKRPMTDFVTTQSAQIVNYTVAAKVYTYAGPDSSVVLAEANRRLADYVAASHRLGRDVTMSGLYSALHVEGVQRVEITAPTQNVVVTRTQATYCTGTAITYGGTDE